MAANLPRLRHISEGKPSSDYSEVMHEFIQFSFTADCRSQERARSSVDNIRRHHAHADDIFPRKSDIAMDFQISILINRQPVRCGLFRQPITCSTA